MPIPIMFHLRNNHVPQLLFIINLSLKGVMTDSFSLSANISHSIACLMSWLKLIQAPIINHVNGMCNTILNSTKFVRLHSCQLVYIYVQFSASSLEILSLMWRFFEYPIFGFRI